jgi:hypothetical protein
MIPQFARWSAVMLFIAAITGLPVSAQAIGVTAVRGLDFGTLLPGMSQAVPATEGLARAEVLIEAQGRVTVSLSLPAALTSPTGASVSLSFAEGDGIYRIGAGDAVPYDPRSPFSISVRGNSTVAVFLGGRATTVDTQPSGVYSGTVTVQVFSGG